MANNIQRNRGRPENYKFDRGGQPTEFGPYIGTVMNNIDPTRSGRLQVWIEQFAGDDPMDSSLWRTVSYIPPFYGVTPKNNASGSTGVGSYEGNQQSYGMWFTPPDIGVQVICFFVAGDPNQGYYLGCVPDPGVTHMIPAIGASRRFATQNADQKTQADFADTKQLPVVEINQDNPAINDNPRFFDQTKPVHSYVFSILANQGLLADYIRGPISSSAQRESPSSVFGVSTPGRAIYQAGITDTEIKRRLDSGALKVEDLRVEGRRGGHSIVLDDGDLRGRDNLIRIRTAKGHQITMSDEADCFYFIHANGQSWIEMGSEGTVDVYSTNSVNIRSQGEINLHADKNININAGEALNIRAKNTYVESLNNLTITGVNDFLMYSKQRIAMRSDGAVNIDSARAGWRSSGAMILRGSRIDLNGPTPDSVTAPKPIVDFRLDDTKFVPGKGWQIEPASLETIVTRAPTHEPYPYHNRGVPVQVQVVSTAPPPAKPPVAKALASAQNVPVVSAKPNIATTGTIGSVPAGTAAGGAAAAAVAQAQTAAGATAQQAAQNAVGQAQAQLSSVAVQAQNAAQQAASSAAGAAGSAVGIDAAKVLATPVATAAIGNLDRAQVTGLVAQARTAVDQAAGAVSVDKGIGQYGFNPSQLEASGLLKPGTVSNLENINPGAPTAADIAEAQRINSQGGDVTPEQVARNRKTNEFLSSPLAWTGKGGATNLDSVLSNPDLQTQVQQQLMSNSLTGLQTSGLATGAEVPKDLGAMVQSATKFGVDTVTGFVKGITPPGLTGLVAGTIKSAQFATDFITNKLGEFTSLERRADAVANTVDRGVVDQAVTSSLGNPKIPAPQFSPQEREPDVPSELDAPRQEFDAVVTAASEFLQQAYDRFNTLLTEAIALQEQGSVTVAEVEAFGARRDSAREFYNSQRASKLTPVNTAAKALPQSLRSEAGIQVDSITTRIRVVIGLADSVKAIYEELKQRVGLG